MKEIQVKNQAELDQALKDGAMPICIGNGVFEVRGSSNVMAYGSSNVIACDSSNVRAYGSSNVRACDSSNVRATPSVPIVVHSEAAKIVGGKVIRIQNPKTATQWCSFYGVPIVKGVAVLFKAVTEDFKSNRGFDYTPGTTPVAPDWDGGKQECGIGLHLSPRPFMELEFHGEAKRYIACPVRVKDIVVHPDGEYPQKGKAKGCCAPVWECDIDGNRVK